MPSCARRRADAEGDADRQRGTRAAQRPGRKRSPAPEAQRTGRASGADRPLLPYLWRAAEPRPDPSAAERCLRRAERSGPGPRARHAERASERAGGATPGRGGGTEAPHRRRYRSQPRFHGRRRRWSAPTSGPSPVGASVAGEAAASGGHLVEASIRTAVAVGTRRHRSLPPSRTPSRRRPDRALSGERVAAVALRGHDRRRSGSGRLQELAGRSVHVVY